VLLPLFGAIIFNIWLNAGKMDYRLQHLVHFYILFSLQYNMTIQFRINNIYKNNYASAISHNNLYYVIANGESITIWISFSRPNAVPNC